MRTIEQKSLALAILIILFPISWVLNPILAQERLRLATTTSTENSGLLDVLLPPFEKKFNVKVEVIAVGTGAALKLGENGDVDVVLVHSKEAEEKFVAHGFGINRRVVMYNDFVIVGPSTDPAGIRGTRDVVMALTKIATKGSFFISRGDESGTHQKEKSLWQLAGIRPKGKWYLESGQGMGATLIIADAKKAYTLTDRGTFIAFQDKVKLTILSEGDERLSNPYGIIAVNPAQYPHVNYLYAMALIGWMTSQQGQKIIRNFRKNGQLLFNPAAIPFQEK